MLLALCHFVCVQDMIEAVRTKDHLPPTRNLIHERLHTKMGRKHSNSKCDLPRHRTQITKPYLYPLTVQAAYVGKSSQVQDLQCLYEIGVRFKAIS